MPRGSHNRGGRRAFTLIELAFVLVLLGLLATVAVPSLARISGANLRKSTERLSSLCRYIYDAAVVKNNVYRLQLELDKPGDRQQTYWIEVLDQGSAGAEKKPDKTERGQEVESFVADHELLRGTEELPSGVRFKGVRLPQKEGIQESGLAAIQFYPDGSADPAFIYLSDDSGQNVYTLLLHPLTGRVRVERGQIDHENQLGK